MVFLKSTPFDTGIAQKQEVCEPQPIQTIPSVESLIEDLKVELEAAVEICDRLQADLDVARDHKVDILRKLTNLRMAVIAQEKGGVQ